ncbi:MAG: alpha/beta-type small acid-soluble spore protein [bacterium]|nr:alpha/beta-type small acid-soluble spore protein [bacterium]
MARRRTQESLVPGSRQGLDALKLQVAREFGIARRPETATQVTDPASYRQLLDRAKYEIADELGLTPVIQTRGWADLPSRANGAVGGRLGGQIGGHMVRRMIHLAEQSLAGPQRSPGE